MAKSNPINLNSKNVEAGPKQSPAQSLSSAIQVSKDALPKTQTNIEGKVSELAAKPLTPSAVKPNATTVDPFGSSNNPLGIYPNDVVRLDVYNAVDQYLESNYRVGTFTKTSTEVTLDPEADLSGLGYISGRYRTDYKFHRNLLGSGDAHKLQIQEISADGLEIRVVPALSTQYSNVNFLSFFENGFFKIPKAQTLTNLFLFKDANTLVQVFDYVQDKFTFPTTPYSIVFKLATPVPQGVIIGDLLWLAQQVSEDITDNITIVPPKIQSKKKYIAGPNWDVVSKTTAGTSTQYRDWDDLLSTNTQTSSDIVNNLLSGSLLEGVPLNIDYKSFENHIQFGSATERLLNFKYKMQLLESYNSRISQLTTGLIGLPSSSVSGSTYYQNNVIDAQTKKAALLGSMDGYEKYLYYQSSSYVTNSYGEFYPSTWPKSNSTNPYANYSATSSQVNDWFDGIYASASLYDQNNDRALYKLIPPHVLEDSANEEYVLFTHMIGHYYDLLYAYVKQMTKTYNRDESLLEGFSKELVYHVSKNLGIDLENGTNLEELWSYALGTDVTGSLTSTYGISNQDKTKEVWKRIVNNLPYLLKTKGTERGVRALINCFGIPQTILRVREYGGAEPDFDTKTDLQYERFNYALRIGYNGRTSGNVFNSFVVPWRDIVGFNNKKPMTIELRAKMVKNQTKTQRLLEKSGSFYIDAFRSGSGGYLGFYLSSTAAGTGAVWASAAVSCSIYDGDWHHIALRREVETDTSTDDQTYTLIIKKAAYGKVVATYTASLFINGSTSSSYNNSYITTTGTAQQQMFVPSLRATNAKYGVTINPATSHSAAFWTGSVQEFRYWTSILQDSILDNHTLAPTSFQGNLLDTHTGSTSSFYTLAYRLTLGSDNKKIDLYQSVATASLSSSHPNQAVSPFQNNVTNSTDFLNFSGSYYEPVTEIHSLEWPDLGGNRSIGDKIRIDNTTLAGEDNQLYRNNRVVRASSDNQPPDSSRLGVYFSPVNETNQDIAEQFGGISIDDYIGNPADINNVVYPDLEQLQREYFKKYRSKGAVQNYIRLLKYYDAALFKMIERFIPHRANAQVGLVIEPHILHRSKVPTSLPTFEELHYSASIDISPETFIKPGGFVEDADGEPFRNSPGYVPAGTIGGDEASYINISSTPQEIVVDRNQDGIDWSPTLDDLEYDMVVIDGTSLRPDPTVIADSDSTSITSFPAALGSGLADYKRAETDNGTVNLALTAYGRDTKAFGSQYVFMSYAQSGSGATISKPYMVTSSRYDYHEALNPVIMDSARSAIANITNNVYDRDVYGGKAFKDNTVWQSSTPYPTTYNFNSADAVYGNNWTSAYGLDIVSVNVNSIERWPYGNFVSTAYWFLNTTTGLSFTGAPDTGIEYGAKIQVPAFFYRDDDPSTWDYLYEVTLSDFYTSNLVNATNGEARLYFGSFDNTTYETLWTFGASAPISTTKKTQTFTTKATGPWLGIELYRLLHATKQMSVYFPTIRVKCLNYRAQVQDFHLQDSYGMKNARYNGCKMTSADWNVNSPDTTDGGPVVSVTVGGGKQLSVAPNTKGTFKIR